jgi:peptide/nickel transport system substrate-binding protein
MAILTVKRSATAGLKDGLDVEITVRNSPAWEANAVTVMAQQWADVGIRVKINSVPTSVFWKNWTVVPFGFTSWAHRPLGIMTLSLAYRTGGTWNESDYSNPEFDALLTQAEGLLDVDKRRAVFAKIEALLQEDGPIVQSLWRIVRTGYDKRVKGFAMHPTQYIFAEDLTLASA